LARKLIANGEKDHKLNFPEDHTEVNPEKRSNYFGVSYNQRYSMWCAYRRSKNDHKIVHNGTYKNEETAAHASDTLAKLLITNGEKDHKLNFPDDTTEMFPETKREKYFGVSYNEKYAKWQAMRWSKYENKNVYNGTYKDEETAAHASDTLARELLENCEQKLKLNFPDDDTEVHREKHKKKRKRSEILGNLQDN